MISVYYNFVLLASTYGSGAYDTGNYNGTGTSAANSGSLSNTGIAVAAIVTVAAVLLLTAMVVRIWKRKPKSKSDKN